MSHFTDKGTYPCRRGTREELARLLGKPSANAARMALERALVRLAAEMHGVGAQQTPKPPSSDSPER